MSLAPHQSALFRVRRAFPLAVFCDFDGTFSVQDVGATLAKLHAGDRRPTVWARYERGEITAWEYNLEILDGLPLPEAELEAFLRTIELDPGADQLLAWCRKHTVPFRVLSDGFDYNLNRLQALHGVSFAYDANHLRYQDGRWRIAGGHPNPACGCGTGTCKRGRIEAFRADHPGATLVHIGNGRVSDLCGALAADVAFAKDSLAVELDGRGAAYEPFETLCDVIPHLERLLAGRAPEMAGRPGRILVIGAGLAGLAAAWRLSRLGFDVRVLERAARAGGRAASDSVEGFRFEPAGSLLSSADRELLAWTDDLGLRDELLPLRPAVPAQVFRGRAHAIDPRGLFGVAAIPGVRRLQAPPARAPAEAARALPARSSSPMRRSARRRSTTAASRDFGGLYFGASVAERWMAPLAGTLGDSPDTSRALFLRRHRTHAEALLGLPRAALAEIVDAAASRLAILTGVEAIGVERLAGALRVHARERGRDRSFEADALVVAVPAPEVARVAGGVLVSAEREGLARVRYAPKLALVLGPPARAASASALDLGSARRGRAAGVGRARARRGGRARAGGPRARASRGEIRLRGRRRRPHPTTRWSRSFRRAFESVIEGARGAVAWSRLYRLPLATPRFDVGRYREIAAFEGVVADQRRAGRRVYFAGDYLMDPTWNGALLSGQRAARALQADLEGRPTARAERS